MRIIEKGCDPSIKLAKFKFNCDECAKSIPNPLPQNLNHFMMIVGKPGSSKTLLALAPASHAPSAFAWYTSARVARYRADVGCRLKHHHLIHGRFSRHVVVACTRARGQLRSE